MQSSMSSRAEPVRAYIGIARYGAPSGRPPSTKWRARTRAPISGNGKCAIARRMCPPASPSWSRRDMMTSSAVPDTTPSWPRRDTAFASVQFETPAPMPP